MEILLNDFISSKGLKYFLIYRNNKDLINNSYNLSNIFKILLDKESLYLSTTMIIEGRMDINSSHLCRISIGLHLKQDLLYIHLSNIKSDILRKGYGSEIITNYINSIKKFNKENQNYKFIYIEGYANPTEDIINLDQLTLFYKTNGFTILNNDVGNRSIRLYFKS